MPVYSSTFQACANPAVANSADSDKMLPYSCESTNLGVSQLQRVNVTLLFKNISKLFIQVSEDIRQKISFSRNLQNNIKCNQFNVIQ